MSGWVGNSIGRCHQSSKDQKILMLLYFWNCATHSFPMMSNTLGLKITKMGQNHSTTSIFVPILDRFVHSSWHRLNNLKYGKYDVQVIRDVEGSEDIVETVCPHLPPHLPINIIGSFRTERWKRDLSPRQRCWCCCPRGQNSQTLKKRNHKMDQYGCDCVHDDVDFEDADENGI